MNQKPTSVTLTDRAAEILATHKAKTGISKTRAISAFVEQAHTVGCLLDREPGSHELTSELKRVVDRYRLVCSREMPELEEGELNLVRDVLNGCAMLDAWAVPYISAEIEDGIRLNGLDEKWGIDGPALIKKISSMTTGQLVALVDSVERWWTERPTTKS